ncbi:hypothetical protein [Brachybacterium sp. YJGR34]|uniref:hypothetical protein n=1 Tax=Brachybacterium sp. YJGR34 TaxID=2059911 RepID=UPI0018E5EF0A|nr:hypothetical protein [Brachybacterium sp. YJGR34]
MPAPLQTPSLFTHFDMVDGPMPPGVLGLGDPDVHRIDGVPTMLLGGFSTTFRNRLYAAALDPAADPARGPWRLQADSRGRALALAPDPPRGSWDGAGMHTPSFVPATAAGPARIYYTGRSSRRQYGADSRYAIGVLELRDGRWRRLERPLISGVAPRLSTLEPLVVHDGDRYVMWYQANPFEIGPGDRPDYELRVVESADGLSWSPPRVFATPDEGFFDNAVTQIPGGWMMVLARGADIHGTGGVPPQGLWVTTSATASADRSDWSRPVQVLDTDRAGTAERIGRGTYGPGVLHLEEQERTVLYATGVRAAPSWPRMLARQLLRRRRGVVPAPFHLSVVAMDIPRPRSIAVGGSSLARPS